MIADGIGIRPAHREDHSSTRGIGYGGSCFPKDLRAFIKIAEDHGLDFGLLRETEKINTQMRERFLEKIENVLWINKDKNITIWGLAFKPDTDDIREAPSIEIVRKLYETDANLRLYDPQALKNFQNVFPENENIRYYSDKYEALKDSDALLVITEWDEFRSADLNKVKDLMRLPIIIDGRNLFESEAMDGFEYYSVGREKNVP